MKKSLYVLFVAAVALVAVVAPVLAYDEVDKTIGGSAAPGASANGRALVFRGVYDFSAQTYDTNDIVKLVNVPAGVLVDQVVVSTEDVNQTITNTLYKYSSDAWAAVANSAKAYAADTDGSYVYFLNIPTVSATGPQSTNLTVTVGASIAGSVDETSFGFINTLTTNGVPTEGKLTISVFGLDVLPSARNQ